MEELKKYIVLFLLFFIAAPVATFAHGIDLEQLSAQDAFWMYLKLGFEHIVPLGLDHIFFILCLFLLNPNLKNILWQATAFTVAHSITLGLAMSGVISPPAHIIEPLIALSILFIALENILTDKVRTSRLLIVFAFGLVHGLGFAGALSELGLPKKEFFTSLLSFNVGVELGQLFVIFVSWYAFAKWFREKEWYRKKIVWPASIMMAAVAFYWTIERAFFPS